MAQASALLSKIVAASRFESTAGLGLGLISTLGFEFEHAVMLGSAINSELELELELSPPSEIDFKDKLAVERCLESTD